ncbi:MAG: ABC transporter permease subunit [Candidatus Latescibacteria bacterium]|nr:ABC transporter permease subunit [Candidatus Latescibacterota bacterium]
MLAHFIRKEILDHLLSTRFLVLTVLGVVTIWVSLYDGYAYYRSCLRDYRQAQELTDARIREIIEGPHDSRNQNWREVYFYGFKVHKPPTAMSIFVRGQEQTLPRSKAVLGPVRVRRMTRSPASVEPIRGMHPPLDLGLVVQIVLGLFVLLFTYDAVSGEKESGTLALVGSYGASVNLLLLGKVVGALFSTSVAFLLPILAGTAVISLLPDVGLSADDLGRLALVLAAFGLYIAAMACAGVLCSSLSRNSTSSFVFALTFWVAITIVAPRLSLIIADEVRPAPSAHEMQTEIAGAAQSTQVALRKRKADWRDARSEPGNEWWKTPEGRESELTFSNDANFRTLEARNRGIKRAREKYSNRARDRIGFATGLARLSPAFALSYAAVGLAGTGIDRHQRFEEAYSQYMAVRDVWYLKTDVKLRLQRALPEKYGEYRWDVSDIPRFSYVEQPPDSDIGNALPDLIALVAWALLFLVGAAIALSRYDLR